VSVTRSEIAVGACATHAVSAAKAGAAMTPPRAVANKPVHRTWPIRARLFISANPTVRNLDTRGQIHVDYIAMDIAIVVLVVSQYDWRPSRVLTARLNEALAIAKKHPDIDIHFVTLGANMPGDRFTEAGVARTYLLDHGVESHQVHAVPEGNDTQGSLEA